jgi:DnaJ-class molecular chaperone
MLLLDFELDSWYNYISLKEGAETMVVVCPVCKGSGKPIEKYSRQVHFGDGEYEEKTCWMCDGHGSIEEKPATTRTHIKKYWNVTEEANVR